MWPESLFKHRKYVLGFVSVATILLGLGIPNLSFTTDSRVFYDLDNPRIIDLDRFEEAFVPSHTILFVVTGKLPITEDPIHRKATIWLTDKVSTFSNVSRVDSLSTLSYPFDDNGTLTVTDYLEYVCTQECEGYPSQTLLDPVVLNRLVTKDQRTTGVFGTFLIERHEAEKIEVVATEAQKLRTEFSAAFPSLELRITGAIPIAKAYLEASRQDSSSLFALAALLIVTLLWVLLGDIRITAIMLITGTVAVVITMGTAGWLNTTLNSASSTIPIIVLTLVVASSMHLFTHYTRLRSTNANPDEAIFAALNSNVLPILLTAATSAVSLFSLIAIASPPVRDIGVFASIGVLSGGILTVTLAPLLLNTDRQIAESRLATWIQRKLNQYARLLERGRRISIASLIVFLASIAGLAELEIDDDFVSYLSKSTVVRNDTDFALEYLSGPSHIELDIEVIDSTVFEPDFLGALSALTREIRDLDEVAVAISLSDLLSNIVSAFGDERSLEEIDKDSLAQYFFMYELGLRPGESTSSIVNAERSRTHVSLLLRVTSAREIRALEQKILRLLPKDARMNVVITGENIPVAHLSSSNIPAVALAVFSTLLVTVLILGLYFKNFRTGISTMVAIVVPVACGLGLWGWYSGTIGLAGTVVVAVALGVVIDDAIHLIYQQRSARAQGQGPWESTAYSIHRVGTAITATTIVLVIGLSPLLLSDFKVNQTFAACTGLILLTSMLFDLTILPKLLTWASRDKGDESV